MDKICHKHEILKKEMMLSPCRYKCKLCKLKRVDGYSNPDHVSNPFGYLYLAPTLCRKCVMKEKICMWCDYVK